MDYAKRNAVDDKVRAFIRKVMLVKPPKLICDKVCCCVHCPKTPGCYHARNFIVGHRKAHGTFPTREQLHSAMHGEGK